MKKDTILILIIGMLVLPFSAHGLTIKSVDFQNVEKKSRLQIGLDGQATYDVTREGNNVVLRIGKAKIPASLARPFITEEFETAVKQIIPKQDKEDVVFNITMKQMTPYFVSQDNKLLIMDFDIPADVKKKVQPAEKVTLNPPATPKSKPAAAAEAPVPASQIVAVETSRPQGTIINVDQGPKYKGEKITLDFQNADIHNVLRIIGDVSGLNLVTSDEVKGTITIRLKDVPWDQALDVVLESKDLDKMAMGNVIRIAPADTIKKAQERILATKKTQEQLEPLVTSVIPVNFAKASEITTVIKGKEVGLLSERGNITSEPRTNVLIVKDTKKSVDDINAMVRRLDKPSRQVLISARIVQADSEFTKGLGIAWGGSYRSQSDRSHFGLTGANTSSNTPTGFQNPFSTTVTPGSSASWSSSYVPTPSLAVNFPQNQAAGFGISVGRLGGTAFNLDLMLDIGETVGTADVLARPKVVTLDNKKATIRQGEKYPYIVRDKEGQLSTELKDIDLVLEVTPRVAFDGSVNMEISVKRNAIGSVKNQLGDPSIADREAETEVLVKNGETSVIGGIIEEYTNVTEQKVPYLGDLPVIGYLFKGKTTTKTKNELLIFITPQVLEPVAMQ